MEALTKEEVQKALDEHVMPYIRSHGGEVKIKSIEGNTVRITMWGNCQGCPSAQLTTETIVFEKLKEQLGERVKEVILVNEASPDIINFAKQLLHKD